ncbi:MAG: hypothetical protein RL007_1607 [Bacteroidota bacterium]|jgi:hypothetical protein
MCGHHQANRAQLQLIFHIDIRIAMNRFLFLLLFFPAIVNAQLDRFSPSMQETEFQKRYPEAQRNYEAESYWLNTWDTLSGSVGTSRWKILNDSVSEYYFNSLKAEGPSPNYPDFDSTRVHRMIVSAQKLTKDLENLIGKATVLQRKSIIQNTRIKSGNSVGDNPYYGLYFAQWKMKDSSVITIRVAHEISNANNPNPNVLQAGSLKLTYSYYFEVNVSSSVANSKFPFCVRESRGDLLHRKPRIQTGNANEGLHQYIIVDNEISVKYPATWKFIFRSGVLVEMSYMSVNGRSYGDESEFIAYNSSKYRAEKLLAEGMKSLGTPDTVTNKITPEYEPRDVAVSYKYMYLETAWKTPQGWVYLFLDELGGGKEEFTRFSVRVSFLKMN